MSEPRKIAAADVKVGDRIRRQYGADAWIEGLIASVDEQDRARTAGGALISHGIEDVWLLDRPRLLPTEPGSVIRVTEDGVTSLLELEGGYWFNFDDRLFNPEDIGDDWVELLPREQP